MPRVLLLPLLGLLLAASACGADDRSAADPARSERHARPHSTGARHHGSPRPASTSTPAPATPHHASPHSAPHRPPRAGRTGKTAPMLAMQRVALDAHLLPAERMPALSDGFTWEVLSQGPEDTAPVGACQKTPLESIGALGAVRRTYRAADTSDVAATEVVAGFADARSAWRAHEVLAAWREDCEERLDYPRKEVGPLQSVEVRTGVGDQYLASYATGGRGTGRVAGFGIVRTGRYLSIVEVSTPSVDYPEGWDPARRAVRRISRTFG